MIGLTSLLTAAMALTAGRAPEARAVFAGGCFWGVEWVFEHVKGVQRAIAGYGPGEVESVELRFDPGTVSYRELLEIFFLVAHDPTSRDRQGPDAGPEYRAIVFPADSGQRREVEAYISELTTSHAFSQPIVTEVQPLTTFRMAEAFHQGYAARHLTDPYIATNDVPKLARLKARFPSLYLAPPSP